MSYRASVGMSLVLDIDCPRDDGAGAYEAEWMIGRDGAIRTRIRKLDC